MSGTLTQWFVGAQNDYPFVIDRRPSAAGNDYANHEVDVQVAAKPFPINGMTVEQVANLLAAAPDLLAACERFLNPTDEGPRLEDVIRDAVKKAKGGVA